MIVYRRRTDFQDGPTQRHDVFPRRIVAEGAVLLA
jgi:hypothetical protein